jgi:hypothetical protein
MPRRTSRRLPLLAARQAYERLITPLRAVAARHGYALAVHGTLARDIDLIAVPWSLGDVSDASTLVEAIRAEAQDVSGVTAFWLNDETADPRDYTKRNPEPKPHGRLGWSIHLAGTGTYIDLSVMPRGGQFVETYPQYHNEASA